MAAAAFEQLWLLRVRAVMLEASAALALIGELCGDADTVVALHEGDVAARRQVLDAFECLTALGQRFRELGPAPRRFVAAASIVASAFRAFAAAARDVQRSDRCGSRPGAVKARAAASRRRPRISPRAAWLAGGWRV